MDLDRFNEKVIATLSVKYNKLPCEIRKYKRSQLAEAIAALKFEADEKAEAEKRASI